MKTEVKLNCWNCGSVINVDELLVAQFEDSMRKDLQAELSKREVELNKKREEYKKLTENFEVEKDITVPFNFSNNIFFGQFKVKRTDYNVGRMKGFSKLVSDTIVIDFTIPVTK